MKKAIQLIDQDLTKFEDYFSNAVKSNAPLLDRIMQYIVKRKGKQMRPMFVLLSAKLGGQITNFIQPGCFSDSADIEFNECGEKPAGL